jgi:hypothetical protein
MQHQLINPGMQGWVDSHTFASFWSWYCHALQIIGAVRRMHEHPSLMFQPFADPKACEVELRRKPVGTFVVRLSRGSAGQLAVTYDSMHKGDRESIKHQTLMNLSCLIAKLMLILIRIVASYPLCLLMSSSRSYVDGHGEIANTLIAFFEGLGFGVRFDGKDTYQLFKTLTALLIECNLFQYFYPGGEEFEKKSCLATLTKDGNSEQMEFNPHADAH